MVNERQQGWKIDRHIPIAVIFTIIAQTCGAFWWASSVDRRIESLERLQAESTEQERRIRALENNAASVEERLKNIDGTTQRIERKLDKISVRFNVGISKIDYFAMNLNDLTEVAV